MKVLMIPALSAAPIWVFASTCSSLPEDPARSIKMTDGSVASFFKSVAKFVIETTFAASRL